MATETQKRHDLAAAQLPSHNHCLRSVNAVDLEYVLGDIQTNRGNLHLNGGDLSARPNPASQPPSLAGQRIIFARSCQLTFSATC
jgi:hypothetical protein